MKKTKLVALGLAASLAVGAAGCGNTGATTKPSEESKPSQSTTSESKPAATDEKKVVTIGIQQNANITDYDDNFLTKALEEKFDVDIQFLLLPANNGDFVTKVTLMATSDPDSLPDILMGFACFGSSHQMEMGEAGVFTVINDYVGDKEVMPFFNALDPEVREHMMGVMTQPDGNIYGIAQHTSNVQNNNPEKMWINTAWLEKLGLEMPKTTEELKQALIAFRDKDPNGNGIADEIGVYGRNQGYAQDVVASLMNSFVPWNNNKFNAGLAADQKNPEKLYAVWASEDWQKGLIYLNDLCAKEGVLSPSCFTDDETTYKGTINQNPVIVGLTSYGGPTNLTEEVVRNQFTWCPPFEGPDGYHYFPARCASYNVESVFTCEGEQLELCLNIVDSFFDLNPEGGMYYVKQGYGEYGKDWVSDAETCAKTTNIWVESGVIDEIKVVRLNNTTGEKNNYYWGGAGAGAPESSNGASPVGTYYNGEGSLPATEEYKKEWLAYLNDDTYYPVTLPALNWKVEETDAITNERSNCIQLMRSFYGESVIGAKDPVKDWDAYVKELDKMGLQKFVDMAQQVYDRHLSATE